MGRILWYDYITLSKTEEWNKSSTRQVINVNLPRESVKAIVILFKKKNSTNSK